jgi:voltage-gated sodium channel
LANFLISEPVVITLIFVNTMVLFLDEFPEIHQSTQGVLLWIDYGCVIYFLLEAILKIRIFGFRRYWFSAWNRFDFTVVLLSLPSLLAPVMNVHPFAGFLVLRLGRLFRFFRVFRFIPNAGNIFAGLRRSLRASVGVFAGLMGATMLFGDAAPEHFGTPLKSSYSLFKVFTVEGWYDIPDDLAKGGFSDLMIGLIRVYFIVSVLVGGILGLSLANAVFVDEMTADNTVKVERMVAEMHKEMNEFYTSLQVEQKASWERLQTELQKMQEMIRNSGEGQEQ